jgi:hypothetical protein
MEYINVQSDMIRSIGYEPNSSILEIEFISDNSVWQYSDFPEFLWYEFQAAPSKGKFFHQQIKKRYSEFRVR